MLSLASLTLGFWAGSCRPETERRQVCDRVVSHIVTAPMPVTGQHGEVWVQPIPVVETVCRDLRWECRDGGAWGPCEDGS